jgi:hypothetical protein
MQPGWAVWQHSNLFIEAEPHVVFDPGNAKQWIDCTPIFFQIAAGAERYCSSQATMQRKTSQLQMFLIMFGFRSLTILTY